MARKSNTRAAQGGGTIRQRKDGRWEARITTGRDPGTGRQIQRSIYGATQQEVRKKLAQAVAAVDSGTYKEPCKMTVGQWLDIWTAEYLGHVRLRTLEAYKCQIKNHIRPALGAVRLEELNTHTLQSFYNHLASTRTGKEELSPKSVKNIHGILHKALQQAVAVGYLRFNPADACTLPRVEHKELKPLDEDATGRFLEAVKGHKYECLYRVTLFTGMREGEVLGLTWDCVDQKGGTITINKQLQKTIGGGNEYRLVPTKNGKGRTIAAAPYVMGLLKEQRRQQAAWQLKAGPDWAGNGLVFTDKLGRHLCHHTIYQNFKRLVASIGLPDARFHDLRHSYAVASIRSGDDIKTVQGNLGHATASFTLDVYGHVTDQMKQASAARMENYIKGVLTSKG